MRTIVVTGAKGFVGRHVCSLLCLLGFAVVPLSRVGEGGVPGWDLGASVSENAGLLAGAYGIVHLAARLPVNYDNFDEATACYEKNAIGTLNLLRAAKSIGVRHFVHISTAALYTPSSKELNELSPTIPNRAVSYLASKLAAEAYVAGIAAQYSLPVTVLRLAAVYGPGMATTGLVPVCVQELKTRGRFLVADGNRFRTDLVHVHDVAIAVAAVLERSVFGTFNIASGCIVSPLDLAIAVAQILGVQKREIKVAPHTDKPIYEYAGICIKKARTEFGFHPMLLEQGLANYIDSLQ